MRVTKTEVHAVSASPWIPLDPHKNPVNVGFAVVKSGTGDITFSVKHTFDDVLTEASATEFNHETVSAATANAQGSYLYPISAIRLRVTAVSGVAGATLAVIQAGISR